MFVFVRVICFVSKSSRAQGTGECSASEVRSRELLFSAGEGARYERRGGRKMLLMKSELFVCAVLRLPSVTH